MSKKKISLEHEFGAEIYTFAGKLMNSVAKDLEKGEKVEPSRMYAIAKLLNIIKGWEAGKKEEAELD